MPELPEVESLRLQLADRLIGQQVIGVTLHRKDVVDFSDRGDLTRQQALLRNCVIDTIHRHGKQMLLATKNGHGIRIHLGMTGNLMLNPRPVPAHSHVVWKLDDGSRLVFSDPRRFGHVWVQHDLTFPANLGPDALVITPKQLHQRLLQTRRALKAALLDQTLIAGLGNIYVDELLFATGWHPLTPANRLTSTNCRKLVGVMRPMLRRAITSGGSTLRDYRSSSGEEGKYQTQHKIYARFGQPCLNCGEILQKMIISSRTSTVCPQCQASL